MSLGSLACLVPGTTEAEALENIQDAMREYLAAVDDVLRETPEVNNGKSRLWGKHPTPCLVSIMSEPSERWRR